MSISKHLNPEDPTPRTTDPIVYIPIKVIDLCTVRLEGQETVLKFKNKNVNGRDGDIIPTDRNHQLIRIKRNLTSVEDRIRDAPHIVPFDQYQIIDDPDDPPIDPGTEERTGQAQYINFELIQLYPIKLHGDKQAVTRMFHHKETYEAIGLELEGMRNDAKQQNSWQRDILAARLDPWQQIINVSWGAATEVEVESTVYQSSCTVHNTDKILISLWVRIPQATFDAHSSVTVLHFGPEGEEMETPNDDPEGEPNRIKKRGSRITVTKDGDVTFSIGGEEDSQTKIRCNSEPTELGGDSGMTTDKRFLPPGADPESVSEPPFINVLRLGVVPPWGSDPNVLPKGTDTIKIEYRGIDYPTHWDGPLTWVETEVDEAEDHSSIHLLPGDLITGNITSLTPLHSEKVIFHFWGKGDGTEAGRKDVPYQKAVVAESKGKGFKPDLWNHIYATADTSLPTDYTRGDVPTIESAPILTLAVNAKDYTNTVIKFPTVDDDGNQITVEVDVEPGSSLPFKIAPETVNLSDDYKQTCKPGDNGNDPDADKAPVHMDPFQIAIEGWEFALPIQRDSIFETDDHSAQDQAVIEYAAVQIFTGVAPGANDEESLKLFVRKLDEPLEESKKLTSVEGIQMVPPGGAYKRYGQAAIMLDGPPIDFVADGQGGDGELEALAGPFETFGTLKRFTPKPPYGQGP